MRFVLITLIIISVCFAAYDPLQEALEKGRYGVVLDKSKSLILSGQENARNYYYLGSAYYFLNRYQLADSAFQKVFEYPYLEEMGYQIAGYYEERNEINRATKAYEHLIKDYPQNSVATSLKLGQLYYKLKKYSEAIEIFTTFISEDESRANPLGYFVGISHFILGDYSKAEFYFEMAQRKGFVSPDLDLKLGEIKLSKGDLQTGIDLINKALTDSKEAQTSRVYVLLGEAYTKLNEYNSAAVAFRKAIALGSNSSSVYVNYASNASLGKNFQGIIDVLEPKAAYFGKNSDYLYYLANAYDSLGIRLQAIDYYQKALDAGYQNKDFVKLRMNELAKQNNEEE